MTIELTKFKEAAKTLLLLVVGLGMLILPVHLRCAKVVPVPAEILDSAAQGNSDSLKVVIDWLRGAQNERPDHIVGVLTVLEVAAMRRNLDAARVLAQYHECRDRDKEVRYLGMLAEAGERESMSRLGLYLLGGVGCAVESPRPVEGLRWLGRAAELGDPAALDRLGDCNRDGLGGPVDLERARGFYRRAAAFGVKAAEGKLKALEGATTVPVAIEVNFPGAPGVPGGLTRISYTAISRPARTLGVALGSGQVIVTGETQPLEPAGGDLYCLDPGNLGQGVAACKNAYVVRLAGSSLPVGTWVLRDAKGTTLNADLRPELEKAMTGLYPDASIGYMAAASARLGNEETKSLLLWASSENGACIMKLTGDGRIAAIQKAGDRYCLGKLQAFPIKALGHDVVGFVTDHAGSANYYHWIFWDWSGDKPQVVFDGTSSPVIPKFEDVAGDGTEVMVMDDQNSTYLRPPALYRWSPKSRRFEAADSAFPGFWNRRIEMEIEELKSRRSGEKDSADNSRLPLVVLERLLLDLRARTGPDKVAEVLSLADKYLEPLIRNSGNDYLQRRAKELKKRMHAELHGVLPKE